MRTVPALISREGVLRFALPLWLGIVVLIVASPANRQSHAAEGAAPQAAKAGESVEDLFVEAYKAYRAAEQAETENQASVALAGYKEADRLLQKIVTDHPAWQPAIVEYRVKRTREAITRLQH
jgi:hypothetical protein